MNIPILRISNEEEVVVTLLIEPHLEFYELAPDETVDLYYSYIPDNRVPEKLLQVAFRENEIVVYPPGPFSPVVKNGDLVLEPQQA